MNFDHIKDRAGIIVALSFALAAEIALYQYDKAGAGLILASTDNVVKFGKNAEVEAKLTFAGNKNRLSLLGLFNKDAENFASSRPSEQADTFLDAVKETIEDNAKQLQERTAETCFDKFKTELLILQVHNILDKSLADITVKYAGAFSLDEKVSQNVRFRIETEQCPKNQEFRFFS